MDTSNTTFDALTSLFLGPAAGLSGLAITPDMLVTDRSGGHGPEPSVQVGPHTWGALPQASERAPSHTSPKQRSQATPAGPVGGAGEAQPVRSDAPRLRLAGGSRADVPRGQAGDVRAGSLAHAPCLGRGRAGGVIVEALVLGNLPGLASLWPAQYAALVAAELRTGVVLVVAGAEHLSIRTFGIPGDVAARGAARPATDALAEVAGQVGRVMVVVASPDDESRVLSDERTSIITLLTGADDASAVGAYRTIKRLASVTDATREPGAQPVDVRLAFMGSPGERARAAWERLCASARNFLDVGVTLGGIVPRIETLSDSRPVFEGRHEGPTAELVFGVIESVGPKLVGPSPEPFEATEQAGPHEAGPHEAGPHEAGPHEAGAHEAGALEDESGQAESARSSNELHPSDRLPVPGTQSPAAATGADRSPLDEIHRSKLSPHQSVPVLAGLTPLGVVCPGHPGVLLASDHEGRAHAVALATSHVPLAADKDPRHVARAGDDQRVQACVYRLVSVGAWLRANAPLLGAISRGHLREELAPVLHIVTDRPGAVRGLIDSDVRVHACGLASTAVDGLVLTAVN